MPSSPMGNSHGQRTSSRYVIITLGKHTQLDNVRRGKLSSPLYRTHDQMLLGVACLHGLRQNTRLDYDGRVMPSSPLGNKQSNDVGRGMQSSPLDNSTLRQRCPCMLSSHLDGTHGRMTSGVACLNVPWAAHTVGRRRAWHSIIALGRHTRSNDVGHAITSSPSGSTHCWMMSGVACHHCHWKTYTIILRRA